MTYLKYSDLSETQKRAVDAFVAEMPELATANSIARTTIEDLYWKLHAKRATSGVKIGFPGWLVRTEKLGRGVYPFPGPKATGAPAAVQKQKAKASKTTSIPVKPVDTSKVEKEFLQDLADCGIVATDTAEA